MTLIYLNLLAAHSGGQVIRAKNFLGQIRSNFPDRKIRAFIRQGDREKFSLRASNIEYIEVAIGAGIVGLLARLVWENTFMVFRLKYSKASIFLTFSHSLPFLSLGIPSVVAVSNVAPFFRPRSAVASSRYQRFRLWALKRSILSSCRVANRVLALSKFCCDLLVLNGIPSCKIDVIHNGVEPVQNITPAGTSRENFILVVSHFYSYKNFEQVVLAYASIDKDLKNKHDLFIVGKFCDLAYFKKIQDLINDLGLEKNIQLISEKSSKELAEFYRKARIFVFSSLVENCPNILLEAMSYGLPILSIDSAPMPEFAGESAVYFAAGDIDSCRHGMDKLLREKKLREELAESAMEKSREYTWEDFTSKVVKTIDGIYHKES